MKECEKCDAIIATCDYCCKPIYLGEPFWKSPARKTFHAKCLPLNKKIEINLQVNAKLQNKKIPRKFGDCEACGVHGQIETHHIIERYRGGTNSPENLINLCKKCHNALTHTLKEPEWSMAPELMRDRLKRVMHYIDVINMTRSFHLKLMKHDSNCKYFMGGKEVKPKEILHHYFIEVDTK